MSEGTNAGAPATKASSSSHPPDQLNLRVTYLIAGNPRPPHDLGLIPASTTISELKARLQSELLEHPQPHEQRLIYQGRPLQQSNLSLREALRLEGPIGPLPYTIHIIISSRPVSSHFRPSQPIPMSQQQPATEAQPPQAQPMQNPQVDPHAALERAQRVQAMVQAQMNMLQQQLAILNPPLAQMPHNFNATIQIRGHHVHPPPNIPLPAPLTNHFEPGGLVSGFAQYQQQQQAQTPLQTTTAALPNHMPAEPTPPPTHPLSGLRPSLDPPPRPLSAPGNPAPRLEPPPRTSRLPVHTHLPPPFGIHSHNWMPSQTQPTVWLASSRTGPEALLFAPGHGYYRAGAPHSAYNTISADVTSSSTTTPQTVPTATTIQPDAPTPAPQPPNAAAAPPAAQPRANAQVARLQRQLQRNQNANVDNEDVFAFLVQRGWLFVRLYMFMFVLSEPGTWRRYMLLFLAIFVCILPRRNPLNNAFTAARRHLDNLIGPPRPQARHQRQPDIVAAVNPAQAQRQQQPGSATRHGSAGEGSSRPPPQGAVSTTPEETAQRLLREHQQRNPNAVRDLFYRTEQAVAMFLASLIPGVGERHVAAREEFRREEERARQEEQARREEEEKKRKEEQEEQTSTDGAAAGPSTAEKGKGPVSTEELAQQEQNTVEQGGSPNDVEVPGDGQGGEVRARFS